MLATRAAPLTGAQAEILCGEWQTGPEERGHSQEDYNVLLPIVRVIRHPSFDAASNGPASGSDIAVFKVDDSQLRATRGSRIFPICLPPEGRSRSLSGIHSGWSSPPPLGFLERYAEGYTPYYSDFLKQWHYKMDILEVCQDPTVSQTFGLSLQYPSNSYYPAGLTCAKDFSRQSCFSTGASGSPLMVREDQRPDRFYMEGFLSFVKGCDTFTIGASNPERTAWQLTQLSENPAAYTKLSCFLPWVAAQYGLGHPRDTDPRCEESQGQSQVSRPCRSALTLASASQGERECIFPFYYQGRLYNECILLEEAGFVYPVFRCPTWHITTKIDGTNSFTFLEPTQGYCFNAAGELDPSATCLDFLKTPPLTQCKNDCPGGKISPFINGSSSQCEHLVSSVVEPYWPQQGSPALLVFYLWQVTYSGGLHVKLPPPRRPGHRCGGSSGHQSCLCRALVPSTLWPVLRPQGVGQGDSVPQVLLTMCNWLDII